MITRYIFKELVYHFIVLLGIFTVILLAKEIHDTRDEIMEYEPSASLIARYVGLQILPTMARAVPLVSMFAVLFSLGLMAKNRELIALVAAGVSFHRLLVPVLIYGILVSAGSFGLSEFVSPGAEKRADYLYEVEIRGHNPLFLLANDDIYRPGAGARFYGMASFDGVNKVMTRPSIIERSDDRSGISSRIEADRARLIDADAPGGTLWELDNAERWTLNEEGGAVTESLGTYRMTLEPKLDGLLEPERPAADMSVTELREYCDVLARQGGGSIRLPGYLANFQAKLSLPFSCLILAVLGFAIAADLHQKRFVWVFTMGLLFGVAYFLTHESMVGLGSTRWLTETAGLRGPAIAAWTPVALFGVTALWFVRRLSVVH